MKENRISVLHVLSDRSFGGALSWLESFFTEADHRHFRYGVILPHQSEAEKRLSSFPISLIPLAMQESSACPASPLALARAIAAFSPDILQTHGAFLARAIAPLVTPRAYLILTKHCVFESFRSRHPHLAAPLAWVLRPFTHASIATADCAKELLMREGFCEKSILTIPNGVKRAVLPKPDVLRAWQKKYAASDALLTVGFCARLEKEKNPFFLLALARIVARVGTPIRFLVIGEGTQRKMLERQVKASGLSPLFIFTGYLADPLPVLSLCHVLLNCSTLSETRSLALLEGFSLGIPAVASDLLGNCEIVRHFENGLLYPKGDALACGALLLRLASDPPLLKRLSHGAKKSYEKHFTAALTAQRCECFYRALAAHSSEKH